MQTKKMKLCDILFDAGGYILPVSNIMELSKPCAVYLNLTTASPLLLQIKHIDMIIT